MEEPREQYVSRLYRDLIEEVQRRNENEEEEQGKGELSLCQDLAAL